MQISLGNRQDMDRIAIAILPFLFVTSWIEMVAGSRGTETLLCGGCTFLVSQEGSLSRQGLCSDDCTSLDLSLRGIKNISQGALAGLTNLYHLSLDSNELSDLDAATFAGLPNLYYLFLSDNHLKSLPAGIFQGLASLYLLSLENNQLSRLAGSLLEEVGSLQFLLLSNNRLTSLPSTALSGVSNLRYLFLPGNQLSSIPADVLHGLYQLYYLSLDHNLLSSLAMDTFDALYSLEWLLLNDNRLTCIPTSAFQYLPLAYIDVRNNSIPCYQTEWPSLLLHDVPLPACKEATDCNGTTLSELCPAGSYSITGTLQDLEDCGGMHGRGDCTCTTSSSYSPDFPCTDAYDNNLGSIIHTQDYSTNWLRIDLGAADGLSKDISRVTLVSRGDCCWDRASYNQVYIGGDGTSALNNVLCGTYGAFTSGSEQQTLECRLRGRYVWVYKAYSTAPMNWAEITIQGCNPCPEGLTTAGAGATSISQCHNLSGHSPPMSHQLNSSWIPSGSNISIVNCHLNVSWAHILLRLCRSSPPRNCSFVTGGLGKLMVVGVEEVWVCQYGHPCVQSRSSQVSAIRSKPASGPRDGDEWAQEGIGAFCFIYEEIG